MSVIIDNLLKKAKIAKLSQEEAHNFMTLKPVTVQAGISIKATIQLLKEKRINSLPVVDANSKLIGIISEKDLLNQAASKDISNPIEFTKKVKYVYPNTTLDEILGLLDKQSLKGLPVVNENGTLIGIISRIDILNKLVSA